MRSLFTLVFLTLVAGALFADDIVTMPTANQLKAGEIDVAGYYLALDFPDGAPQCVYYQTLYVGLSDKIELDIHRAKVDKNADSAILVVSYKLVSETNQDPDIVIGWRNIAGQATSLDNPFTDKDERSLSKKGSYYLSFAKTFFMNPSKPGPPLVRAHFSVGTEDWTLLGEKRHEGIFGGLQFLLVPEVGLVVQHDGQDVITGLTIMPPKTGLTFKLGTYGDHSWYGVSYRKLFQ